MMTASTSTLMPEEMTLPSTRSARKAVLPNRPNGISTKPASVVSLNSISVTKSWIARMKKASSTITQANSRHGDLDEVLEEADVAHQVRRSSRAAAGRRRARPGRCVPGAGDRRRTARAGGLQAEAGKALEDDRGEAVPVADDVGEDADEQRLLDQAGDDVLVGAPGPEQRGERHVDDDQRGGEEADLAAEQAEAAIDVAGEDLQKRSMTPVPSMAQLASGVARTDTLRHRLVIRRRGSPGRDRRDRSAGSVRRFSSHAAKRRAVLAPSTVRQLVSAPAVARSVTAAAVGRRRRAASTSAACAAGRLDAVRRHAEAAIVQAARRHRRCRGQPTAP